jgi:hypothetical protein
MPIRLFVVAVACLCLLVTACGPKYRVNPGVSESEAQEIVAAVQPLIGPDEFVIVVFEVDEAHRRGPTLPDGRILGATTKLDEEAAEGRVFYFQWEATRSAWVLVHTLGWIS